MSYRTFLAIATIYVLAGCLHAAEKTPRLELYGAVGLSDSHSDFYQSGSHSGPLYGGGLSMSLSPHWGLDLFFAKTHTKSDLVEPDGSEQHRSEDIRIIMAGAIFQSPPHGTIQPFVLFGAGTVANTDHVRDRQLDENGNSILDSFSFTENSGGIEIGGGMRFRPVTWLSIRPEARFMWANVSCIEASVNLGFAWK